MRSVAVFASRGEPARRRVWASAGVSLLMSLAGCAVAPEVQTLATGRPDVSAYALNGTDLGELQQAAGLLCPLGSEVLRQSTQGALPTTAVEGRWRRALQASTLWLDPPQRLAQLVILCRQPGDRMQLVPAPVRSAASSAAAQPVSAASVARAADAATPVFSAALPVGPVMPEW